MVLDKTSHVIKIFKKYKRKPEQEPQDALSNATSAFDVSKPTNVIPNFYDVSKYYDEFTKVIDTAKEKKIVKAKACIAKIAELKDEMHILQDMKEKGDLPLNFIYTDKLLSGIVYNDFGNAVRTICNTAAEDEKDLSKVEFDMKAYKTYKENFLKQLRGYLTSLEIKYLPLSAKTIMFITGLRFLTDYLNNDVCYKVAYREHNLVRAKNQFKLIDSFSSQIHENFLIENKCFV